MSEATPVGSRDAAPRSRALPGGRRPARPRGGRRRRRAPVRARRRVARLARRSPDRGRRGRWRPPGQGPGAPDRPLGRRRRFDRRGRARGPALIWDPRPCGPTGQGRVRHGAGAAGGGPPRRDPDHRAGSLRRPAAGPHPGERVAPRASGARRHRDRAPGRPLAALARDRAGSGRRQGRPPRAGRRRWARVAAAARRRRHRHHDARAALPVAGRAAPGGARAGPVQRPHGSRRQRRRACRPAPGGGDRPG